MNDTLFMSKMPYKNEIQRHGGVHEVAKQILQDVYPSIIDLQGQTISQERLNLIRDSQEPRMRMNLKGQFCYLIYVTDDRNTAYLRFYVGQTASLKRRVLSQHFQNTMQGSVETLHYFTIWLGNGHRTSNVILLSKNFNKKQSNNDTWLQLKTNITEAVFCVVFSSHHGALLPKKHPINLWPTDLGYGLNIMSPLIQNGPKIPYQNEISQRGIEKSPDPQIFAWSNFRRKKKDKAGARVQCSSEKRLLTRDDFLAQLEEAVGAELVRKFEESRSGRKVNRADITSLNSLHVPFTGSLDAKIGFILDYALESPANDTLIDIEEKDGDSGEEIPWQLKGCLFNKENVLIWTHNMLGFSTLFARSSTITDASTDDLASLYTRIVKASQLQIICVCGPRAAAITRHHLNHPPTYILKLHAFEFKLYVAKRAGLLYLICPELSSNAWSANSFHNTKLTEAIRFAISITQTKYLRPYFIESSSIVSEILTLRKYDKRGGEQMTLETLPTGLRFWLER